MDYTSLIHPTDLTFAFYIISPITVEIGGGWTKGAILHRLIGFGLLDGRRRHKKILFFDNGRGGKSGDYSVVLRVALRFPSPTALFDRACAFDHG